MSLSYTNNPKSVIQNGSLWGKDNKPFKNAARTNQLAGAALNAKTALFLPGSGCECVKEAMKMGLIDRDSYVIAVERLPSVAKTIHETLTNMELNYMIHPKELHLLRFNRKKIDFAFLDLMGSMSRETAFWLTQELSPNLRDGSAVSFTFQKSQRKQTFINSCETILRKHFQTEFGYLRLDLRIRDDLHRAYMFALRACLSEWDFKSEISEYNDGSACMVAIKLTNFKKIRGGSNNPRIGLEDIISLMPVETPIQKTSVAKVGLTQPAFIEAPIISTNPETSMPVTTFNKFDTAISLLKLAAKEISISDRELALTEEYIRNIEKEEKAAVTKIKPKIMTTREILSKYVKVGGTKAIKIVPTALTIEEIRSNAAKKAWATRRANGWTPSKNN
jgi:hypothetical protein